LRLPSAPPKATDRRAAFVDAATRQAEALDPTDLARLVRAAIVTRFDLAAYQAVLREEEKSRQDVFSRLGLDAAGNALSVICGGISQ
jgi:hypothetical protein